MIAFGPVPSRRLGRSLGVNHIPPKHCTYSCSYCQLGPTACPEVDRRRFHPAAEVVERVARKLDECRGAGCPVDWVTFVPDGEPTLDEGLGAMIRGVRALGRPVAVLTNGSLLARPDVRDELAAADLVSVKVDAADRPTWRRVNRPDRRLDFDGMLDGILAFAGAYRGTLLTETMLLDGVNDGLDCVERTAGFLGKVAPRRAYLAWPTRPPADPRVRPANEGAVGRAWRAMTAALPQVEILASDESGFFPCTGAPLQHLEAVIAVHPMRSRDVAAYLARAGLPLDSVDRLVAEGRARRLSYRGDTFLAAPLMERPRGPRGTAS